MHVVASLFTYLIWTLIRLPGSDGTRALVAESLLITHQLLIQNRSRQRAPKLRPPDRVIAGVLAALIRPARLVRSSIVLKPSTIVRFHRALVRRKYRLIFTPKHRGKPGPKGPAPELITAFCEMKRRNPSLRCESLILKTHWVMVVMDQYMRRIVGFAVHAGAMDGPAICRRFGRIAA